MLMTILTFLGILVVFVIAAVLWILAPRLVSAVALAVAVLAVTFSTSLPNPLLGGIVFLCVIGVIFALIEQGILFKEDLKAFLDSF